MQGKGVCELNRNGAFNNKFKIITGFSFLFEYSYILVIDYIWFNEKKNSEIKQFK